MRQAPSRATFVLLAFALAGTSAASGRAQPPAGPPAAAARPAGAAWVAQSNAHAKVLLDVMASLSPESAAQLGLDGFDDGITRLDAESVDRAIAANRAAATELRSRLARETDPRVKQDLQILISSAEDAVKGLELQRQHFVPFINVSGAVFGGLRGLLDDQVAAARRPAALVRLRKYAGVEPGYAPFAKQAEALTRARLATPGLLFPARAQVERALADSKAFVDGLGSLFQKYGLAGYEAPLEQLRGQIAAYETFVRSEILPRARTDFRLPPAIYAFNLEQYGVDIPPATLTTRAHEAFDQIQREMQALAPTVAKARGWTMTDYREVIRALKQEQLVGDAILPHYQARLKELERIIAREKLVTLPTRPARIRLASEAETAASPAPNMRPPRLIGNTGEQGEFVLPLNVPSTDGRSLRSDDFTFEAASWTLTAHEARPGHEMQFAGIIEAGVSTARALFSFNSTNVEGWGLYAERIVQPFMPPEGQLISLQHRLMRAARAFLDPELQSGTITPEQAFAKLTTDVVLSDAMARQEVDRYTFRAPGQATSYFHGYTTLMELRAEVEQRLGTRFEARAFHDAILAQGLLPPPLMRQAVLEALGVRAGSGN
jgi:uncharacterized protein (DUF885 family)